MEDGRKKKIRVRLEWIKEHSKMWGNERADTLAEREREKSMDKLACTLFSWLAAESRRETIQHWERKFQDQGAKRGTLYCLMPEIRHHTRSEAGE